MIKTVNVHQTKYNLSINYKIKKEGKRPFEIYRTKTGCWRIFTLTD